MTNLNLRPAQALKKSYLKIKPVREHFDNFKEALQRLLKQLNHKEREEHNKNWISDFFKDAFYKRDYAINTLNTVDLAIHLGQDAENSPVGVLIEAKSLVNKSQMASIDNINTRALQELVLYFLRQRLTNNNLEIKHLIITDGLKWFVFDAVVFEQLFVGNKILVKQFEDFEAKRLSGNTTPFFYNDIATKHIKDVIDKLQYVYFNLNDYKTALTDINEEEKLIEIYKIFSPQHLLKLPFANDSNTLDKGFYSELLHILGLEEQKHGAKKLINQKSAPTRNSGAILENCIAKIASKELLQKLDNVVQYGETQEQQYFGVGMELLITWINRILFLKLLEAQLITYHQKKEGYAFLNLKKIPNYGALNELFFDILAKRQSERSGDISKELINVPYLNSTLFERTDLEKSTIEIDVLRVDKTMPIFADTVLKDDLGKPRKGEINTLAYLFEFLDAYNFGSESGEEIQEEDKKLINASVLGLIFEKINGYKDGSFFTPGFITMYMCGETIRRAVVQKFNDAMDWACQTFEELKYSIAEAKSNIKNVANKITYNQKLNDVINDIKICDPAVGSGHFLVSALNEIILIKYDLNILQNYDQSIWLDYAVSIENDELIITHEALGTPFKYNFNVPQKQIIQKTLFHEKQTIIENCLFGVDINPNSVKICRLRLWIELLKHTYYKAHNELETLPNIDINIKCGNSLISRFGLDADLTKALRKSNYTIDSYRIVVQSYRNAQSKKDKEEFEKTISKIKDNFTKNVSPNDHLTKKLNAKVGELDDLLNQSSLFELTLAQQKKRNKARERIEQELSKLSAEVEDMKNNRIYDNAFEWRFEFPEILSDEGDFIGFDVVIGNPPYGVSLKESEKNLFKITFANVHMRTPDSFNYFISLALDLAKNKAGVSYIVPNNLLYQGEYEKARTLLIKQNQLISAINLGDGVFDSATVPSCIFFVQKNDSTNYNQFYFADLRHSENNKINFNNLQTQQLSQILATPALIFGISNAHFNLLKKIELQSITINDIALEMASGISTGADKVFRLPLAKANDLQLEKELIKPVLLGSEINTYQIVYEDFVLIYSNKKTNTDKKNNIFNYLLPFKEQLSQKRETKNGTLPWWCLHWHRSPELFEGKKIIMRQTSDHIQAVYDEKGYYVLNSILVFKLKDEKIYNYYFCLGLLNSKLTQFVYKSFTQEEGRTFAEVKPQNVRKLFIPKINIKQQKEISDVVRQILAIKATDARADIAVFEQEIDKKIYSLYNLTADEIKIIEESTK